MSSTMEVPKEALEKLSASKKDNYARPLSESTIQGAKAAIEKWLASEKGATTGNDTFDQVCLFRNETCTNFISELMF